MKGIGQDCRREQTGREERAGVMNGTGQDCTYIGESRQEGKKEGGLMNGAGQDRRREQTGSEERRE